MFDDITAQQIAERALRLELDPSVLLAVAEVESGGRLFANINNRDEPLIRFEGHYFDRLLQGNQRETARKAGLASPGAGAIRNSRSQSGRWKMLRRAMAINRAAALSSTSWGLGQVMGAHWNWLGYGSVDAMVSRARSGAIGQMDLMLRYIERSDLIPILQNHDWATFARRYNGPGYKKYKYDQKLRQAYHRISNARSVTWRKDLKRLGTVTGKTIFLQLGSTGPEVSSLQARLKRLGYLITVDGMFGVETDRVIRQVQHRSGHAQTGVADDRTMALLKGRRLFDGYQLEGVANRFLNAANRKLLSKTCNSNTEKRSSVHAVGSWLLSIFKRIA